MRARAPRADLQEPDLVHRRDAAAARADLDQLDGGDADGQPAALDEAPLPRGLEAVGGERLAPVHQRELGGGAAHVEGEHVAARAVRPAEEGGRDGARGRARLQHLHRDALRLLHVGEPAAREHQQERRRDAQLRHAPGHQGEVLLGERLDVGVGRRGGGALVLADLGRHLVRGGHRDRRDGASRSAAPPPSRGAGWRRRGGTPPRWTRRPPPPARRPARPASACRDAARSGRRPASARSPRAAGDAAPAARAWRWPGRRARTSARARSRACPRSPRW